MILGFLSDAHGNQHGLAAGLRALQTTDASRIYFAGDSVGYLPFEELVLQQLRDARATCIRGNHEAMLLGDLTYSQDLDAVYQIRGARQRVSAASLRWLAEWPVQFAFDVDGARILLIHGAPSNPLAGYLYPDSDLSALGDLPFDFIVCGHTHRPFIRKAGALTVVNAGSCGLPRDVGNLSSCAIIDLTSGTAEILRSTFDVDELVLAAGDAIHDSVVECLRRPRVPSMVGRIVHE